METLQNHPEIEADRRADRRTWLFFSLFLLASFLVESLSDQYELVRAGNPHPNLAWLSQATSHLVVLALVPFITFMLSRFPLGAGQWRRNLLAHAGGTLVFSGAHILLMVALRKVFTPLIYGFPYEFGLTNLSTWFYEYRIDVLSYALIATIFAVNRLAEQRTLEVEAARREARDRNRLTLKSGGRTYFVDAGDVVWAKAASNYVEVITPRKTYLARMTLTDLSKLLESAGGRHVRVHRSHIVNLDRVEEIVPTGEGDVVLRLDTGEEVAGSRRYRDALEAAAS